MLRQPRRKFHISKAKIIKDDRLSRHLHLEKSHGCDNEIKDTPQFFFKDDNQDE